MGALDMPTSDDRETPRAIECELVHTLRKKFRGRRLGIIRTGGDPAVAYSQWRREGERSPFNKAAIYLLNLTYDWSHRSAWLAAALAALLFFYAVIYAFPNARLTALQQERDALEEENRAFCEKYGMPFGTREHTLCAEDLMDIRANQRQRTLDWLGIF
jgi:hypothetical protein